jgi:hypothetical protein
LKELRDLFLPIPLQEMEAEVWDLLVPQECLSFDLGFNSGDTTNEETNWSSNKEIKLDPAEATKDHQSWNRTW